MADDVERLRGGNLDAVIACRRSTLYIIDPSRGSGRELLNRWSRYQR
jgi:hypothetical protein